MSSAEPKAGIDRPEFANHEIQVAGEDLENVVVTTTPASTIRGRLTFAEVGTTPALRPESLRITPRFAGTTVAPGRVTVSDDWTFLIRDVLGEGLLRITDATDTWFLDAIYREGRDVTDETLDFKALDGQELELRLTRQRTTVTGSAVDSKGVAVSSYVAVVFTQDAARWKRDSRYIAIARSDQSGRFSVVGLPPADYFAAAVERIEAGEEFSTDFLERLRVVADRVSLQKGSTRQLRLTVAPVIK